MRAGLMRRRVQYQEPVSTDDAYGQSIPVWTTRYTCWAQIRSLSGREATLALQTKAEVSELITIRYQGSRPTPAGRLLLGTRVLNITMVNNIDERNRQVDLQCTEVHAPKANP